MSILFASSRILAKQLFAKNVTKTLKCNNIIQTALISFGNGLKQKNMVIQAIKARPGETLDDKNARLGRPLSPHLSIYRPQITSIMSIIHRVFGFVVSGYLFIFAVGALVLPEKYDYYMDEAEFYYKDNLPEWSHLVPKFIIAFPFIQHTIGGIRHLCFDLGLFLTMPMLYTTAAIVVCVVFAVFGGTIALPYMLYDIEKKAEEEMKKNKK